MTETEMQRSHWKILLVEDDEDDFVLTRHLLADAKGDQFDLTWLSTYETALEACVNDSYDVCLVDYRLGEHDGLELVRQAVHNGCKAPIILLTGKGNYEVDVEAMKIGVTDYLVKGDLNPPLLERTIRYAIERKQAEEALRKAHDELEIRVQERTQELGEANERLAKTNEELRAEIAERQRVEEALRKSENRFRKLAESTSSAIFIVQDFKIRYANPAVKIITGYDPEELLDFHFWEIAHPAYREALKSSGIAKPWSSNVPARFELKLLTKKKEERWVDVTAGSLEFEGLQSLVVTAFDITERDLAEQALRKAKADLETRVAERTADLRKANENLARANQQLEVELEERKRAVEELNKDAVQIEVQHLLIQSREIERLHIAQDLHDGPLQELLGISFTMSDMLQIASKNNALNEVYLIKLSTLQERLKGQIRDLRIFCSELRPPTLTPLGLEKAIRSHSDSFQERNPGLKINLELTPDSQQLPEKIRLALFRIYQELLNNIVRHAHAQEVEVCFSLDESQALVEVKDDGCGFEVPNTWIEMARQGHLGLVGVQERVEAAGGSMSIVSSPGCGTRVRVSIPRQSTRKGGVFDEYQEQ